MIVHVTLLAAHSYPIISTATRHKPDYQVIHSSETVLLEAVHNCAARDVLLNAVSPFCVALCRTFICDI